MEIVSNRLFSNQEHRVFEYAIISQVAVMPGAIKAVIEKQV